MSTLKMQQCTTIGDTVNALEIQQKNNVGGKGIEKISNNQIKKVVILFNDKPTDQIGIS